MTRKQVKLVLKHIFYVSNYGRILSLVCDAESICLVSNYGQYAYSTRLVSNYRRLLSLGRAVDSSVWSVRLRVSALFLTMGSMSILPALFLTTGGYSVWAELWTVQEICRGSVYGLLLSSLLPAFCLSFVMLCSFFAIIFVVFMFTLGVPGGDYLSGDEEGFFFFVSP